ncbi:uncharacterized protein ACOB8E_009319 isoform 1-T1 [Sarcophilus harrisii]
MPRKGTFVFHKSMETRYFADYPASSLKKKLESSLGKGFSHDWHEEGIALEPTHWIRPGISPEVANVNGRIEEEIPTAFSSLPSGPSHMASLFHFKKHCEFTAAREIPYRNVDYSENKVKQ